MERRKRAMRGPPADETNAYDRPLLSGSRTVVSSVASRLEPARCAEAAHMLAVALQVETDAGARKLLAKSLSLVSSRLKPAEAEEVCQKSINS